MSYQTRYHWYQSYLATKIHTQTLAHDALIRRSGGQHTHRPFDIHGRCIWDSCPELGGKSQELILGILKRKLLISSLSFGREVGLGLSSCTVSGILCAKLRIDHTRGTSMLRLLLLVRTNDLMSPLTTYLTTLARSFLSSPLLGNNGRWRKPLILSCQASCIPDLILSSLPQAILLVIRLPAGISPVIRVLLELHSLLAMNSAWILW